MTSAVELGRLEGTVAIAQVDPDVRLKDDEIVMWIYRVSINRHHEIQVAVAVEIADGQIIQSLPGSHGNWRLERTVPLTEEDIYKRIGSHRQIGRAVVVKVRYVDGVIPSRVYGIA